MAFLVVPFQVDSNVFGSLHVDHDGIVLFEGVSEMIEVLHAGVLDKEIVYYKGEYYWVGFVFEETWGEACLLVSGRLESGDEDVAGDFAGLRESVHTFVYSGIDVAVFGDIVGEVVLEPDSFWDVFSAEADEFRAW
jgi:hypothetical protein